MQRCYEAKVNEGYVHSEQVERDKPLASSNRGVGNETSKSSKLDRQDVLTKNSLLPGGDLPGTVCTNRIPCKYGPYIK